MNTQDFNQQHTGNRYFLLAKKHGFDFKSARERHEEKCNRKDEIIEDLGERPKPFKVILSFICIGIALVFAFIESLNVKTTIVGATGMGDTAAVMVGIAFAAAGLVAGHFLSAAWKKDNFSGKSKPTPLFYIGLAFTLVYLIGQYYLASRAGVNTGEDMQETVTTMKWFILGIAISEVLFGIAFLATAIKVFSLFIANIRIKTVLKAMKFHSRSTEEAWQRYVFEIDTHNKSHEHPISIEAETETIKAARHFYNNGGFDFSNDKN